MKNSLFILLFSLIMLSCGKDDSCSATDFTGIYEIQDEGCLITGSDLQLSAVASGTGINFEWKGGGNRLTLDGPLLVTNCTAAITIIDPVSNTDLKVNALLNGKTLTISYTGKFNGTAKTCTETFKK